MIPDNLLINLALQTPENLAGKMVATSDGKMVYAISQSGFTILPVANVDNFPIAAVANNVLLLENDQCGVTAPYKTQTVAVQNQGKGNLSINATLQSTTTNATTPPLGGGGPGGFTFPGLPVFVVGAPGAGGGGPGGGGFGGGGPGGGAGGGGFAGGGAGGGVATGTRTAVTATSTTVAIADCAKRHPVASSLLITLPMRHRLARSLHDFAIQATTAVNIPPRIRVYQNNRNAEAAGTIIPISVGVSTSEGLKVDTR